MTRGERIAALHFDVGRAQSGFFSVRCGTCEGWVTSSQKLLARHLDSPTHLAREREDARIFVRQDLAADMEMVLRLAAAFGETGSSTLQYAATKLLADMDARIEERFR